jgi:1,4-alpha-glucan branching enzyme
MWSLADNPELKYQFMDRFERAMIDLVKQHHLLAAASAHQLNMDEGNKVIVFERAGLIFVFNFHCERSIFDYKFYVPQQGRYRIILNSDDGQFGGHQRVASNIDYFSDDKSFLSLYVTSRTVIVLKKMDGQ